MADITLAAREAVMSWGGNFAAILFQGFIVIVLLGILIYIAWAQLSYPKKWPFLKWNKMIAWYNYANGLTAKLDAYSLAKMGLGGMEDVGLVKSEPDARIMPIVMNQIYAMKGLGGVPVVWRPHKGEFYPCELLTAPGSQEAINAVAKRDSLINDQQELLKEHAKLEEQFSKSESEKEKAELSAKAKELVKDINDLTKQAELLANAIQAKGRPVFHPIIPPGAKKWTIGKSREAIVRHVKKAPWEQLALLGAAILIIVGSIMNIWLLAGTTKETAELNLRAQQASIEQVRNITGLCKSYCEGYAPPQSSTPQIVTPAVLPQGG